MPGSASRPNGPSGGLRFDALVLCAILAACAAVLSGIAWTHSTTTSAVASYRQTGALSYSAPAPPTSIYGASGVQTGQPVYQRVVTNLQIKYSYRFLMSSHAVLHGTEQLVAVLDEGQGLTKTLPLQSPTPFKGTKFTATANLSLGSLQAMVSEYQHFNQNSGATYTVSIVPTVTVNGRLTSTSFRATFDPTTRFTFDGSVLIPTFHTSGSATNNATTTSGSRQPIVAATSGSFSLGGRTAKLLGGITVGDAQIASLAILAVLLGLVGLLGWPYLKESRSDDERVRIAAKLSSSMVEVSSISRPPATTVEVSSFDGLEQVSNRLECPVLHLRTNMRDEYAVVDNGTVYLYRIDDQPEHRLGRVVPANADSPRHATASRGSSGKRARSS